MSETASYPRRKKNQTIAKQVIGKVIFGKPNETKIINELTNLTEYIENKNYTPDQIQEWIPTFADRTFAEMVMIHKEIYAQLATRIKQSDCTFLQTYRMYLTMRTLEPERYIPVSNPKIKFCAKYYLMDAAAHLADSFKMIALIDTCLLAAQKKN